MSVCLNHTDRPAANRCKSCLKPLCDECGTKTPYGLFCSDKCHQGALDHAKRLQDIANRNKQTPAWLRPLVWLIETAALVALAWYIFPHLPASIKTPVLHWWHTISGHH